ncbi:DUF4432 family protein [Pirellulales bacterium]|nr:DUF4432 family protein [Pirellulales bacterium]
MTAISKLTPLPGFNPHRLAGFPLPLGDNAVAYVVPDRGLDVLDVRIGDEAVMYVNPAGHLARPISDLDHIEGFFTAGLENTGPPAMGLPLHGTFGWRPAGDLTFENDAAGQPSIRGIIHAVDMVRGPYIKVERTVTPLAHGIGFRVEDALTASVDSEFMLLYHPNFPIDNGTQFVANAEVVAARDQISDLEIEDYARFQRVGKGEALLPPADSRERAISENFEQAYVIQLTPEADGSVWAMLVAADGETAAYIRCHGDGFDPAQRPLCLWKNPRAAVAGLERGNTFCGREYAKEQDIISRLGAGEQRRYVVEVGFLRTASEVEEYRRAHASENSTPELRKSPGASGRALAELYRGA